MRTQAYVRRLAAGLMCMSMATGVGAAVIDPAFAALLGIPAVELTGAYAEATAEAIVLTVPEVDINTASGSDPATIDVTTSSTVTGVSGSATAGADFPDPNGMGSATRGSASVLSSDYSIADSVGTGFISGGFEASGGGAGPHTVTFNFDITALVSLADGHADEDLLTAGVSAFALVFDDTFLDVFLAGFSLDGGGAAGTMAMRSGDWIDILFDGDFVENTGLDPLTGCAAAAIGTIPNRCSWAIDTTASVTYEYMGDFAAFSLLYGIQTSVLGLGTIYELVSDASGTSILASIETSEGVDVSAQPSQLVPEPTSAALLGIGLLLLGAPAGKRGLSPFPKPGSSRARGD
jgi:hypothetical protein